MTVNPKGRRILIAIAAALGIVVIGCVVGLLTAKDSIDRFVQDKFYDNVPTGVPCSELPTRAVVRKAIDAKPALVKKIEAVGGQPGSIAILVDDVRCRPQDQAEIVIFYPGHSERVKIEAILKEETFSVPVALRNA
jgi:hypothetical protein